MAGRAGSSKSAVLQFSMYKLFGGSSSYFIYFDLMGSADGTSSNLDTLKANALEAGIDSLGAPTCIDALLTRSS